MLVISRRIGESFLIGENIEATVVDITGEKVVLGIQAPKEVSITRTDASSNDTQSRSAINAKGYGRKYRSKLAESDSGNG